MWVESELLCAMCGEWGVCVGDGAGIEGDAELGD